MPVSISFNQFSAFFSISNELMPFESLFFNFDCSAFWIRCNVQWIWNLVEIHLKLLTFIIGVFCYLTKYYLFIMIIVYIHTVYIYIFRKTAENSKQCKHRWRKIQNRRRGWGTATHFDLAQGSHQAVGQVGKRTLLMLDDVNVGNALGLYTLFPLDNFCLQSLQVFYKFNEFSLLSLFIQSK